MRFSQRIGKRNAEKLLQHESIDEELRNSLWSLLTAFYWDNFNKEKYYMTHRSDYISDSNLNNLFQALWFSYFKKPIDTIPTLFYDDNNGLGILRKYFFKSEWYDVYDFIEFVSENGPAGCAADFIKACNHTLDVENSPYRFVNGKISEISSEDEIKEIEDAITKSTPYYGVKQHLQSAISKLSDRKSPDYRNSIKESISAVESLCKTLSNNDKTTLGVALNSLEKRGKLHPALKSAFSSLYGYTNDANGIRHSLMEESNLNSADARFMLISCSAFINYVISVEHNA